MIISIDSTYPSTVYNRFHFVQHNTSLYPEKVTTEAIEELLDGLIECYARSTFTSSVVRHAIVAIHQLIILVIAKRCELLTKGLFEKLVRFFASESFKEFLDTNQENGKLAPSGGIVGYKLNTAHSSHFKLFAPFNAVSIAIEADQDEPSDPADVEEHRENIRRKKPVTTKYIFSGSTMILPRILIYYFNASNEESFRVLGEYLLLLIDNNFITLDTLNEHLMTLLRYDWSADKYKQLSKLMKTLAMKSSKCNESKDDMLLDVLSQLTADIDDFEEDQF